MRYCLFRLSLRGRLHLSIFLAGYLPLWRCRPISFGANYEFIISELNQTWMDCFLFLDLGYIWLFFCCYFLPMLEFSAVVTQILWWIMVNSILYNIVTQYIVPRRVCFVMIYCKNKWYNPKDFQTVFISITVHRNMYIQIHPQSAVKRKSEAKRELLSIVRNAQLHKTWKRTVWYYKHGILPRKCSAKLARVVAHHHTCTYN